MPAIDFRSATTSDVPFLLDSWMKSWRTTKWAGCIRNDMYYEVQRSTIEGLIARGAEFIIACSAKNPDNILGWICHEPGQQATVIHYLYVKDPYVRLDIQRQLLDRVPGSKPGFYTHAYRQVQEVCGKGWRHCPEIARRREGAKRSVLQDPGADSGL